ncbi:DUF805 domain-containing protein [Glycomyces sp. YM15]|uniref:DUF805 domain-containing protein n=1 Tax=Glycomyces sp. YM15 TaxID=2800446 RepID=UPI001964D2B5|nr:DUF805 domain-containing protein [Glycomyces sp. YM15]
MNWYINVIKNYVGFSGRARRTEYWMFVLFNAIIMFALYLPFLITREPALTALYAVYALAVFLPALAVTVRRLHDIDKSGWWYLISFVPLAGPIILIVLTATAGKPGPNQYGPDPKAA